MNIQDFDFTIDGLEDLMWQDNNSTNLRYLMELYTERIKAIHTDFWEDWYKNVYNLKTANDFGLHVWSIILELPLFGTNTPSPPSYRAFGFNTAGINNFDQTNFATDSNLRFQLELEDKRKLLQLRYHQLTARANSFETNRFLTEIFGRGIIKVKNNQDMTIDVVQTGSISNDVLRVMKEYDLIPRDAGVEARYVFGEIKNWGFAPESRNFFDGNFFGSPNNE